MVEFPRVRVDEAAYLRRARAACFVCEVVAGNADYPNEVVYRDRDAIAFVAGGQRVLGHLLVAPAAHREHAVGDFDEDEYAALQRVVHRVGRALTAEVETERLYVLSLGSQQANRHVHWHLVPLPPGVPYDQQQTELFGLGPLDVPASVTAALAGRLRARLG